MSKVTSKLQVTVHKAIADRYRIRPGDEIEWAPAGDAIRVIPRKRSKPVNDRTARLKLFDESVARQRKRDIAWGRVPTPRDRGWTREELYVRGRSR
jgi:bifunctional DNA-binding transcriptional regulator/antitoxin component of YhaV-PrlF toxin-antitoxin module